MSRTATSLALLTLVAGTAPALHAQGRDRGLVELPSRPMRSGFYITGGIGNGMEQYKFSDDPAGYTDRLSSPAAVIRIGGSPNASLRVGAELFGWWNSYYSETQQQNATDTFGTLMLVGQVYPAPKAGFYLKGGLGLAHSGSSFEDGSSVNESGFGFTVGAGYDIALSRNVAISPVIDFYQGSFSQRGQPTLTERVLNVGASITFQSSGRRR